MRSLCAICLLLFARHAMAISVGDLTYFMGPDTDYLTREVRNDSAQAHVYAVSVVETAPPYKDAKTWKPGPGELLYAPKQLLLQPHRNNWLRLYYKGPATDAPRYYRVTFTEQRAATTGGGNLQVRPKLSLDTILVVQPRHARQSFHAENGRISNDGNTVYLATVYGHCPNRSDCYLSRYLAPGQTLDYASLLEPGQGNQMVTGNEKVEQTELPSQVSPAGSGAASAPALPHS